MTILVTGAAGFIGSNLTETLLNQGQTVVGIDDFNDYYDPAYKRSNISGFKDHPNLSFYELDIRDEAGIEKLFATHKPTAIAHLGAYGGVRYSIGRAKLYTHVNLVGTINLLEAAREHGLGNFVFASTSSAYGKTEQLPFIETDPCNQPLAPYPASKKAGEMFGYTYNNLHQMNFTAVRFFSVYGPRGRPDMMPFMVMDRIVKGEEIILFDAGQMKRDWTYVDDIVSGVIAALERPLGYEIINLGRGEPILMADFVQSIEKLVGKKAVLSTPPAPASEPKITFANIDKARRLLDYNPQTAVGDGLAKMWDWYQAVVMGR
ncbi:NAD-dependent epimerase/dehydratase family protein [Anaerolineales bacterium HSG24]|nr:NAD-dependent epimerase/dehydratase family protein [Anaerolineales bacterium HSG24]